MAQAVKNLPAMQETWDQSLGQEDPLEEGMAVHASILAWRIPWTEEPGRGTVHGVTKSQTQLSFHFLSFPSPGDLPGPGVELGCPALQADSLPPEPPGKPVYGPKPLHISVA